jgi:hypothetical protein
MRILRRARLVHNSPREVWCYAKSTPHRLRLRLLYRARQDRHSGWTDKNNGQEYAAYTLRTTCYEPGDMSAHVNFKRSGEEDVFVVSPGPVFHFKDVKMVGLPENLARQMMNDAPQTGEVYSQARINHWLAEGSKQLAEASSVQKFAETRLDPATATATLTVWFK